MRDAATIHHRHSHSFHSDFRFKSFSIKSNGGDIVVCVCGRECECERVNALVV